MAVIKRILKWIGYSLLLPIAYGLVSLLLSYITIERENEDELTETSIFLSTNGVHLDIVMPTEYLAPSLADDLELGPRTQYLAFGWGDAEFYLNTPTWGDLTFTNAFSALFLNSATLMHVTRYDGKRAGWIEVKVSKTELQRLNDFLFASFQTDAQGNKLILEGKGYFTNDDFYKANGSYSCFKTCNSWVNSGFRQSGLKSCFWTPFDFGLMNKYD
ncbi:DUF2459 domain-containing protein [Flagellimonas sp. DF-77]|uniref:DUF2459 domain-containing protein n=1 Tax=Flagellimonas algarum TaxID=3230298 RepID=UPI00339B5E43